VADRGTIPIPRARRTIPHLRWYICGLLFLATTINYVDRQVLGLLKPVISRELHWSEADYGWIVFSFQAAYGLLLLLSGRVLDLIGTRTGFAIAVVVWSLAAMAHALARTAGGFSIARFALGAGEAANFPASIKTVTEWFPARERALAVGIFNSGTNVGALITPLLVPFIAAAWGWQGAFIATGALGFVWLALWLWFYRRPEEHPYLGPAEFTLIREGRPAAASPAARVPWGQLFLTRRTWAFAAGKFLTDPVWWFYLFWLPGFLNRTYGLDLLQMGLPIVAVYLAADVGSVGGGWLSSSLLKRGWSLNSARKTAMLICAVAVLPVMLVSQVGGHLWIAVMLIGLAAAAHQAWSANLFTLASDMFPSEAVGSVVGIGGMVGSVGGMLVAPAIGYWLDWSHGAYGPLFLWAGTMYLVALGVIHFLVPTLRPAPAD
jgi:ACS family hexuronate transporter-like MFS transporter